MLEFALLHKCPCKFCAQNAQHVSVGTASVMLLVHEVGRSCELAEEHLGGSVSLSRHACVAAEEHFGDRFEFSCTAFWHKGQRQLLSVEGTFGIFTWISKGPFQR